MIKFERSFFYFLFCLCLALTWLFHKDTGRFNEQSEIWSDRAGYYIYLPATFFYHFDTRKMPPDLDVATGGGFSIDTLHNRLETRYTYGVALMVSPFFLATHLVSVVAGKDDEQGFSILYHRMMNLAAVVYLIAGLWLLKRFLDRYFRPGISRAVLLLIFSGTNLFYYSMIEGLMSHVYSFFLFAWFLFSLMKFRDTGQYRWFLALAFSLALATLIRPTNILLGLAFFFLDAQRLKTVWSRLRQVFQLKTLPVFLLILFILFIPQMVYWKYLTGHWLYFSYRDEGFTNLAHPAVGAVLFSPVNGLITHTPLVLLFIAGMGIMLIKKIPDGWFITLLFLLLTWLFSSWKMWYFGCSYGQRSYIEYYALFALPAGYFLKSLFNPGGFILKSLVFFLIFLFIYSNIRMTVSLYRYERCYYGSTWDWDHYLRLMERSGILSPIRQNRSFDNDFENLALCPVKKPSMVFTRSGQYSIATEKKSEITPLYSVPLSVFGYPFPKMIGVDAWILKPGIQPTGATVSYTFTKDGAVLYNDEMALDSMVKESQTWTRIHKTFIIPDQYDSTLRINLFLQNKKGALLYLDDLRLKFEYVW